MGGFILGGRGNHGHEKACENVCETCGSVVGTNTDGSCLPLVAVIVVLQGGSERFVNFKNSGPNHAHDRVVFANPQIRFFAGQSRAGAVVNIFDMLIVPLPWQTKVLLRVQLVSALVGIHLEFGGVVWALAGV